MSDIQIPMPTPETQHFWDGTRRGKLLLQRCRACRHIYFPPRPFCPRCQCQAVDAFEASGKAHLYSYVICHRPPLGWPPEPYSLALVELAEGPRMVSNIVNVEQSTRSLILDMPLVVTWKPLSDRIWLPVFEPAP